MHILFFVGIGFLSGLVFPELHVDLLSLSILYAFLFCVGIYMGAHPGWSAVFQGGGRMLIVPLAVILGSLAGALLVAALTLTIGLKEAAAIAAGFGYYSLSSAIISQSGGPFLGSVALLSNLLRELLTMVAAPLFAKLGKLAPIAAGGATSMDVSLPVIVHASGNEYAITSFISGAILTLLVPILVPFIMHLAI